MLVFAFNCKAQTMGEFSREEFTSGCHSIQVDDVESLKRCLPSLKSELSDPAILREIFKYSFQFYKETKEAKSLDIALVDVVLELLIPNNTHIPQFRKYLKEQSEYKVINLDQWMNILNFSTEIGPNFEGYTDDGECWPTLFDNFVIFAKEGGSTAGTDKQETKDNNGESSDRSDD